MGFCPLSKGEFGDSRLVELPEAQSHHPVVLGFGGGRQRKDETCGTAEVECNAGIFRGMRGGEKTGMIALLHIFAVGDQHTGIGAGLGKHLSQHR